MLDGDTREWYADYFRQHGSIPTWKTLINDFSRYFSTQGKGEKNLHEAWRKMTFMPATDDIEVFIRDIQELAKQLNYTDQVLITTLRAAMPREIYGTLYKMEDLSKMIDFCKNYYAKSPAERQKIQDAGRLEANPFKKMQVEEDPPNHQRLPCQIDRKSEQNGLHTKTLQTHSVSLWKRQRSRQRRKTTRQESPQETPNLPSSPIEEEVEEVSEENSAEENLTEVLQKGFPERTPRQKMPTKIGVGIATRLDIG